MKKKNELDLIMEKIPEDRKEEASLIYKELKFITSQTRKLRAEIRRNGCVEDFKQGKQEFKRESPSLTSYIKFMKTYDTFYKNLLALVPKEKQMSDDEIDEKYF